MKVLIATHHYYDLTGSETFAYTLAKTLMFKGCHVTLYSPYIGGVITEKTLQLGIRVFNSLQAIKEEKFDLVHLSHNLIAIELRYCFPHTPIIFLSHGVLPFLEQPPLEDLNISKYLVVSEEVKDNLMQKGIPNDQILIFRNIIDTQRFSPFSEMDEKPKRVLVNSRRMDQQTRSIVAEACKRLGLEMTFIGNPGNIEWEVEKYVNQADICISLGRGILEAMSCGRAAIVFDYNDGDGLVTADNIDEIQKCNFSGRRFKRRFSVETLIEEIKKYNKHMGVTNRWMIEERFSAKKNVDSLIDIYEKAIDSFEYQPLMYDRLNYLKNLLIETRNYSVEIERRRLDGIVRDKESALINLQCALQDNNQNIVQLQDLIKEKDSDIANLNEAVAQEESQIAHLESVVREKETEAEKLVVDLTERERKIKTLEETISQKESHFYISISNLETAIREKNAHIENLENLAKENETESQALRASLAEKDASIKHIYNSHGWKALLIYYKLRDKILPVNSWRRRVGKVVWRFRTYVCG